MSNILGSLLLTTLICSNSAAAVKSSKCQEVADDLKAMQKAQKSISESLISNHDTFADLLSDYSSALSMSAAMGKPVTMDAVTKMGESSKSFRERGENATKLNKKLTTASDEVIAKAVACLTK